MAAAERSPPAPCVKIRNVGCCAEGGWERRQETSLPSLFAEGIVNEVKDLGEVEFSALGGVGLVGTFSACSPSPLTCFASVVGLLGLVGTFSACFSSPLIVFALVADLLGFVAGAALVTFSGFKSGWFDVVVRRWRVDLLKVP